MTKTRLEIKFEERERQKRQRCAELDQKVKKIAEKHGLEIKPTYSWDDSVYYLFFRSLQLKNKILRFELYKEFKGTLLELGRQLGELE